VLVIIASVYSSQLMESKAKAISYVALKNVLKGIPMVKIVHAEMVAVVLKS